MSYLQTIKKLHESINSNNEIPCKEKEKAKELLNELSRLLAMY